MALVAMPPFEEFTEAYEWFQRHNGKEEPGPKTDEVETFTLSVAGMTSCIVGYQPADRNSYFRAFVEACNEILYRGGHDE